VLGEIFQPGIVARNKALHCKSRLSAASIDIEKVARRLIIDTSTCGVVDVQLSHGYSNVVVVPNALPISIAKNMGTGLDQRLLGSTTSSPRGYSTQIYLLLTAGQGTPMERCIWNGQKKIKLQYGGRKSGGPALPCLEQGTVKAGLMDREYYSLHTAPVLRAVGLVLAQHRPREYLLMQNLVSEVIKSRFLIDAFI
jgi:hypothetical protein